MIRASDPTQPPGASRPSGGPAGRRLRGVLFDLGNTLIEFENLPRAEQEVRACGSVVEALLQEGVVPGPSRERIAEGLVAALREDSSRADRTLVEYAARDTIGKALAGLGVRVSDPALLERLEEAHYAPITAQVTVYDDAAETLAAIRRMGLRVGLVSNTIWRPAFHEREMRAFGLLPHIEHAVYSSVHGWAKPHPSIFREALKELALDPREAVFVGDRPEKDVAGAKAVGMVPVLKAHRSNDGAPRDGAAAIIGRLSDLLPLLDRLG